MKNFSLFFSLLLVVLLSLSLMAQSPWVTQYAPGLPNSVNPQIIFSAVDMNTCWGINVNNSQFIRTTNGGGNWTVSTITGATGLYGSCISALNANIAFAAMNDPSGITSGGIFKTTDGGTTWSKQNSAFPGADGYPADIHFFDSNNGVVIGEPHNGNWEIYTTINGGIQWTQVPFANIPPPQTSIEFTAAGLYSSVSDNIWFGTWGNSFAIYKSTDRGYTWSRLTGAGSVTFCVAFKDIMNGLATNCFLGLGNRIVKTTDGGSNWTALQNVPATPSTYFISYAHGTQGSYVITSSSNVGAPEPTFPGSRFTSDDGATWSPLMDNLPHFPTSFSNDGWGWSGGINDLIYKIFKDSVVPVELVSFTANVTGNEIELFWQTATETNNKGFEIYRNGNKIAFVEGKGTTTERQDYSFTDKNLQPGIYNYRLNQLDFDGTQAVVGELTVYLSLPEQFALEQNYPNPFNPSTTIRYSIPTSEFVTLKVYDVLGNEVATLVNEEKPAGSYEVNFNAAELSSGIYFYTLQSGSFTQTKKLILMK
jgi:photosystem II stability/assembly factor-like uncharacterized protein